MKYLISILFLLIIIQTLIADEKFKLNNNTVTDTVTNLIWTKCTIKTSTLPDITENCTEAKGLFKWEEALFACNNLNLDGIADWRLPNIKELQSIAAYNNEESPAIDHRYFKRTGLNNYWSSTSFKYDVSLIDPKSEDYAWVIDFNYGNAQYKLKTDTYYVRCVTDFIE